MKLLKVIVGVLVAPSLFVLGWNVLGGADAVGLPAVAWGQAVGLFIALSNIAYCVGRGLDNGRFMARREQVDVEASGW